MGDFSERMLALEEKVGYGILDGLVEVNQPYALIQHEVTWFEHPRGGGPFYLRDPLLAHAVPYVWNLAENVLDGDLPTAMALNMEDLAAQLDPAAPIDEDPNPIRLRRSGNPRVYDDGAEVYNRPALDPPELPGGGNPRGPAGPSR